VPLLREIGFTSMNDCSHDGNVAGATNTLLANESRNRNSAGSQDPCSACPSASRAPRAIGVAAGGRATASSERAVGVADVRVARDCALAETTSICSDVAGESPGRLVTELSRARNR
jgi:hypothetical protein